MILTKGRCDPPFLSQLGFGEEVRGWWGGVLEILGGLGLGRKVFLEVVEIGALDFLGVLELGLEGIFVAERVGAIGILGGLGLGCKEGLWVLSAF